LLELESKFIIFFFKFEALFGVFSRKPYDLMVLLKLYAEVGLLTI